MKIKKIFKYTTITLIVGMFLGLLIFYYMLEIAGIPFPPLSAFGSGVIVMVVIMLGVSIIFGKPKIIQEIQQTLTTTQKEKQSIEADYSALLATLKLEATQKMSFTSALDMLEKKYPKETPFIGQAHSFYFETDGIIKIRLSNKKESKVEYSTLEKKFSTYNQLRKNAD